MKQIKIAWKFDWNIIMNNNFTPKLYDREDVFYTTFYCHVCLGISILQYPIKGMVII